MNFDPMNKSNLCLIALQNDMNNNDHKVMNLKNLVNSTVICYFILSAWYSFLFSPLK